MSGRFPPRAPLSQSLDASALPSLLSRSPPAPSSNAPAPSTHSAAPSTATATATVSDPPTPSQPAQVLHPLPRRLVGLSSKAYFTHAQTLRYTQSLLKFPRTDPAQLRVFFLPSFPGLSSASLLQQQAVAASAGSAVSAASAASAASATSPPPPPPLNLLLGAQDCHFGPAGAGTGSVPASELFELGATFVELGHAERRRAPLCESDSTIADKARMAVGAALVPLVCVGERERPAAHGGGARGRALREVGPQVQSILEAVGPDAHVVFAYEPVWAIGAEEPAPPEHVRDVARGIKALVRETRTEGRGDVRVIYGGSAGPGIWDALKEDVDGLFLGRFGHDVESLRRVVEEMERD